MRTELTAVRRDCARRLLGLHWKNRAGHIGASLSCLEILVDLVFRRMRPEDVLILSKGHAATALYAVLATAGRLEERELGSFYQDGTRLAAHPPCGAAIPSIPFGTGSLGHGLSLACGIAFSQRFTGRRFHVYGVLSDGDCNEGSTWEAALFASHHALSNLTIIVDANGLQGFGYTRDVLDTEPLDEKWKAFGFHTTVAEDGNDLACLDRAHASFGEARSGKPRCIVGRTVKGHGVSFMANRMEWHYLPMNEEQYRQALDELEKARDA